MTSSKPTPLGGKKMLKINEPEVSREEFEALKQMVKENFRDFFIYMAFAAVWPILITNSHIEGYPGLTVIPATIIFGLSFVCCIPATIIFGLSSVCWVLDRMGIITPKRYKFLYKKRRRT